MNRNTYRGKRLDIGEWAYGYFAHVGLHNVILTGEIANIANYLEWEWYEIDPTTLGQCTGLQDKNGRDIFQGDVVKMLSQDNRGNDYEETLWVQWMDEVCGFVGLCETLYRDDMYAPLTSHDRIEVLEIEVIGNVHDTPELLKGVRG